MSTYILQSKPDRSVRLTTGAICNPIATLKNKNGGVSHIIEDDHCYVLVNGADGSPFRITSWWYAEAVEALKRLPALTNG